MPDSILRRSGPSQTSPTSNGSSGDSTPPWGVFTKFLVALVLVSLAGALLVRFQPMIAPLVLAIILAYLPRPVVAGLVAKTWLGWRAAVVLIYLVGLVGLAVLFTAAGIAIVQQAQGLYHAVMQIISPDLPAQLRHLLSAPVQLGPWRLDFSKPFQLGPYGVDLSQVNWQPLYEQLLTGLRPGLLRAGAGLRTLATTTAETVA